MSPKENFYFGCLPEVNLSIGSILQRLVDRTPFTCAEPLHILRRESVIARFGVVRLRQKLPVLRDHVQTLRGVARQPAEHVPCNGSRAQDR